MTTWTNERQPDTGCDVTVRSVSGLLIYQTSHIGPLMSQPSSVVLSVDDIGVTIGTVRLVDTPRGIAHQFVWTLHLRTKGAREMLPTLTINREVAGKIVESLQAFLAGCYQQSEDIINIK